MGWFKGMLMVEVRAPVLRVAFFGGPCRCGRAGALPKWRHLRATLPGTMVGGVAPGACTRCVSTRRVASNSRMELCMLCIAREGAACRQNRCTKQPPPCPGLTSVSLALAVGARPTRAPLATCCRRGASKESRTQVMVPALTKAAPRARSQIAVARAAGCAMHCTWPSSSAKPTAAVVLIALQVCAVPAVLVGGVAQGAYMAWRDECKAHRRHLPVWVTSWLLLIPSYPTCFTTASSHHRCQWYLWGTGRSCPHKWSRLGTSCRTLRGVGRVGSLRSWLVEALPKEPLGCTAKQRLAERTAAVVPVAQEVSAVPAVLVARVAQGACGMEQGRAVCVCATCAGDKRGRRAALRPAAPAAPRRTELMPNGLRCRPMLTHRARPSLTWGRCTGRPCPGQAGRT